MQDVRTLQPTGRIENKTVSELNLDGCSRNLVAAIERVNRIDDRIGVGRRISHRKRISRIALRIDSANLQRRTVLDHERHCIRYALAFILAIRLNDQFVSSVRQCAQTGHIERGL